MSVFAISFFKAPSGTIFSIDSLLKKKFGGDMGILEKFLGLAGTLYACARSTKGLGLGD
jgi:hypothetical protein